MDNLEKRYLERYKRVRDFDAAHDNLFPEGTLGRDLFDNIGGVVTDMESFGSAEKTGDGAKREGTVGKAVALDGIREGFRILRRTARSMSGAMPGFEEKFIIPYGEDGQELVNTVRAALLAAEPYKAEFQRREVQERVFQDIQANIAAYEAGLTSQNIGLGDRQTAGGNIDAAIERGNEALRQLDPIVRNKLHNNPALLAAWLSAKRLERAPRRNNTSTPPAPQTPNT